MALHKLLPVGEIHIPYQWTYATAAARIAAAGFIASDVGKLCRELDDNSVWMLTTVTPSWVKLGADPLVENPATVLHMRDDSDMGGAPPPAPVIGEAFVVNNWGVPHVDGDIEEWDGAAWNIVVPGVGGFPPAATRVLVMGGAPAGSFAGKPAQIADADGAGAYVFTVPIDGAFIIVNGDGSIYENSGYVYDAIAVQWAGVGAGAHHTSHETGGWDALDPDRLGSAVWRPGVVRRMTDDSGMGGAPPVAPATGDAFVVNNWGGAHVNGNVEEWDGAAWNIIVVNAGGFVPVGTRMIVTDIVAAGTFVGQEAMIVIANGAGAYAAYVVVDGDVMVVKGGGSVFQHTAFQYEALTNTWLAVQPIPHAPSHENGGLDEMDVGGLSGVLADPQDPAAHVTDHEVGGGDPINCERIGSQYHNAAVVMRAKGKAGADPGAGGNTGVAYIVSAAWGGFAVGDIIESTGAAWVKIVTQVGGFAPIGTRCVVDPAPSAGVGEPWAGMGNHIVVSDGAGAWYDYTAADMETIQVNHGVAAAGIYAGRMFTFNNGSWVSPFAGNFEQAAIPTVIQIMDGQWGFWWDTVGTKMYQVRNRAGTMYSVELA